jgi:hypothetical protein
MTNQACVQKPESEKLLELRAKTDRQLLNYIHSKLEAGLHSAALSRDRTFAEQTVAEVQHLLAVLADDQKKNLNSMLSKLRAELDGESRAAAGAPAD